MRLVSVGIQSRDVEDSAVVSPETNFKLSFSRLFKTIITYLRWLVQLSFLFLPLVEIRLEWLWNYIRRINDEQTILLLYFLLHGNSLFLSYALARTDLDTLILPLLKILYDVLLQKPQRIYMILIVILILTHDESFCSIVQSLVRFLLTKNLLIIARFALRKKEKFWLANEICIVIVANQTSSLVQRKTIS
jgi:hypothetical protein